MPIEVTTKFLSLQEMVIAETELTDPGKFSEMFNGYHVTYALGECKLVSAVKNLEKQY